MSFLAQRSVRAERSKFREYCAYPPLCGPRFTDGFVNHPEQYSPNFAIKNTFSHALQNYGSTHGRVCRVRETHHEHHWCGVSRGLDTPYRDEAKNVTKSRRSSINNVACKFSGMMEVVAACRSSIAALGNVNVWPAESM